MANLSGKVKREFDAAAAATLRAIADGAETATAAEAPVALNTLNNAYWDNNDQPNGDLRVSISVTSIDRSTDEEYTINIEVDTAAGFSTPKIVATLIEPPTVGYYELVVPASLIEKLEPGATHIRAALVAGGTTPSIDYAAWLTFGGV